VTKVAICFLTKDRVELSKQTIQPLIDSDADIWWFDGSSSSEGKGLPQYFDSPVADKQVLTGLRHNVLGGPDAAVAYAVTTLLASPEHYTHIGLLENDVLLDDDWFERTMDLFEQARSIGLFAGAVSPRCYEDRVLFQYSGFNVMHNLGFGSVIWTREAAELMLKYMRTHWTLENRRAFAQLSGADIGNYWAFRVGEHWLCADWGVDRVLAQHGLCSLALDPSPVEMIGQVPPLKEQGLVLATGRKIGLTHDTPENFKRFVERQLALRTPALQESVASVPIYQVGSGGWMYFAHQLAGFPRYERSGEWRLKWMQGFGPFGYRSDASGATIRLEVSGGCAVLATGYEKGGSILVRDLASGYEVDPLLPPQHEGTAAIMAVMVPSNVSTRIIEIVAEPGVIICGLTVEEPQPLNKLFSFDHTVLPPV